MRRLPKWLRTTLSVTGILFIVGIVGTLVAYVASDTVKDKLDNAFDALKGKESTSETTTQTTSQSILYEADGFTVVEA